MSLSTYQFNDDLGGRFRYIKEPGRLDFLLKQVKRPPCRGSRKSAARIGNDMIKEQAAWYVHHVKTAPRERVLTFFDKGTYAAEFQRRVLIGLGFGSRGYWFTCQTTPKQNEHMAKEAKAKGWSVQIVQVSELKL